MIERLRAALDTGDTQQRSSGPEPDATGSSTPLITLADVTVRLSDVTALAGVSTSVERGQFVGLVGPNGAGKTTLLRTITGALHPDEGSVAVDGTDVSTLSSQAVSRTVAAVPQNTALAFDFDVREIIAMGRTPYRSRFPTGDRADRSIVETAMRQTDVTQFADRSITEVSGGERQRVLLARALAQETPVLLLDEPTASLDINHQRRTLELLSELRREGKTVIAAIHDLNLAAEYCDELRLLADGQLLASGSPEAVLTAETVERAFDTEAVVTRHPVTGSVYVSAIPASGRRADAGTVHVIGGGGSARHILSDLTIAGYTVSVGAVPEGDADLETARELGLDTIVTEPFSPIDAGTAQQVAEKAATADVTILTDVEIRDGNLANLEAVRSVSPLVLVEDRPVRERNHAGSEGRRRYEALRERATVVESAAVRDAVAELVDSGNDTASGVETEDEQPLPQHPESSVR